MGMPDSCRPEAWVIDAGGSNFDATLSLAPNAPRLFGFNAAAYTGIGWKKYKEYGKTYRKRQHRREQCHQRLDIKQGRQIEWVNWHSDYWREVSQMAWLGDTHSPGRCSLFDGRHEEFALQSSAESIIRKGIGLSGEMEWMFIPPNLCGKHDFGDCMAQAYAAAAFAGIGTGGKVDVRSGRKKYSQKDLSRG